MLRTNFGQFKYLGLLFALSITFVLTANMVAGRLMSIDGIAVSVAEIPFPLCYLVTSIIAEVYGYRQARSVTWVTTFCAMLSIFGASLCLIPPSPDFFKDDAAFQTVLSTGTRIAIAVFFAMAFGDLFNSYVVAKIKIWNKGKHFWFRFIVATIASECVNTFLFFGIAFYGVWSNAVLLEACLMGWAVKTVVEVALLPLTYPIVRHLKKVEGVDHYDYKTNFNPFITDVGR
jgi:uncharacterized integral membrane protein (TIGR00697 family)